jgi:serine protease Do
MRKKFQTLYFLVGLLFVLQVASFIYFADGIRNIENSIAETNSLMNQNFNSVNSEINSINSEIEDINSDIYNLDASVSETREDFEDQISKIKAKTSADFSGIIEDVIGSVVSIKTNAAQGSGFLITSDGYIVTNAHVLEGAKYATAITAEQDEYSTSLVGYSSNLDLALLKIEDEGWDYLEFADSDDVDLGDKVIAIGNPYGLSFSVTEGIVSSKGRTISGFGGEYIQTDTAINSGNSGGPLIDVNGEVVGVNNLKIDADNIGFALESNYVAEEVNVIAMEKLGYEII